MKIQKNLEFCGQWKKDMQIEIISFHRQLDQSLLRKDRADLFSAIWEDVRIWLMAQKTRPLYKSKYQRNYYSLYGTRRSTIKDIWRTYKMSVLYDWKKYSWRPAQIKGPRNGTSPTSKHGHILIFRSINWGLQAYNYAVVLVDCNSGYRWIYGMKLKSDMLKIVKKWYSDIAILRQKHKLLVVMREYQGQHVCQTSRPDRILPNPKGVWCGCGIRCRRLSCRFSLPGDIIGAEGG